MQQVIICPQCGQPANHILTNGVVVTACSACYQATVTATTGKRMIVKVDPDKLLGQAAVQRDLLMIALTSKALFENWHRFEGTFVPMGE